MDKFNAIQVFCQVVELGTLSAVAKVQKCSPMMISKHIAQLEASLGVVLLNRNTRSLSLTHAGELYYQRSRQLLSDLSDLEAETGQMGEQIKGQLNINAPIDFGSLYLVPVIEQFIEKYPEVKIHINLDNNSPNLRTGSFDISILVTDTLDQGVVARKIAETELAIYAAPAYLAKYGCPETLSALAEHRCLHYADTPHGNYWLFNDNGEIVKFQTRWFLSTNHGQVLCQAAARGIGIVRAPRLSVNAYLNTGELVEILTPYKYTHLAVYATYLPHRFYPARLSAFIEFLLAYFQR